MYTPETFLREKGIPFVRHEHVAVYTCEDAERHCGHVPGRACKNLLLRCDTDERYVLSILPAEKRADLKRIAHVAGARRVTFASRESLCAVLGVEPGAVSPFGILHDEARVVEVHLDSAIADAETVSFHPNVNTASLVLSGEALQAFLRETGCTVKVYA